MGRCPQCGAHLHEGCILQEMPADWLSKLVNEFLSKKDRLTLFQTCKDFAAVIKQHSTSVEFTPAEELPQNDPARAAALSLAETSSSIHLHLNGDSIVLDNWAVRGRITHLTLKHVVLSRRHISELYLRQLTQLHTISFKVSRTDIVPATLVDSEAMQKLSSIIQEGGLPSLRVLEGEYSSLCALAPVLGNQITKLVLEAFALDDLCSNWPALQQLEVSIRYPAGYFPPPNYTPPNFSEEVLKHPTLRHVAAPVSSLVCKDKELERTKLKLWEVLKLTEAEVSVLELAQLPFHAAKLIQLPNKITYSNSTTSAVSLHEAVKNIQRCEALEFTDKCSNVHMCFKPELVTLIFTKNPAMKGELLLDLLCDKYHSAYLGPAHALALRSIPQGIHSLVFYYWPSPANDCSWGEVFACIPDHITDLYLWSCRVSEKDWHGSLDRPAPKGLRRLKVFDLACCEWLLWLGEDLEDMQQQVKRHWPHVQLLLL